MTTTSKNSGRIVKIESYNTQINIFTELNTDDISIGDYVFIIGGVLDNTNLDISDIYSNGYEVLYVDNSKNIITIAYHEIISTDSYLNSNFYISTSSVVRGEFNGGVFNGGTLGEVGQKHFTFTDARINNGQFLGGDFLQGEAKYTNTNNNGTIINYDKSYSNIVDNTAFKGYTEFVSGDISKIYDSVLDHQINGSDYNIITISNTGLVEFSKFVPYHIENGMKIVFKNSVYNTKIYRFENIDYNTKKLQLIPNSFKETYKDVNNIDVNNDITDIFKTETINNAIIEIYTSKTSIDSVAINMSKIYGGSLENVEIRGGDVYDGDISNSTLKSTKHVLNVYDGNITKSNTSNINFNGGILNDSVWSGDSLYNVTDIVEIDGKLAFNIHDEYKGLINLDYPIFISYAKDSSNTYLPMYDDDSFKKLELVNYQEVDIIKKNNYFVTTIDYISSLNYQNMKVSQTNFNNGVMINNTITSGLLKGNNHKAYLPILDSNNMMRLNVSHDDIVFFDINDLVEVTNLTLKNELEVNGDATFTYEEIMGTCRVFDIDILNNVLVIELPKSDSEKADVIDLQDEGVLVAVEKIYPSRDILITKNIFVSGDIKAGYIDNKIIRKANLDNSIQDKVLISHESYYKRMSGYNAVLTSDTIMYGVTKNSVITNNTGIPCNMSDTIVGNMLNYSDIKRGLLYNLQMESGSITNAYIEKSIWNGGVYKNGFGLYNADSNRSGIENEIGVFEQMSAPSVVYLNKDKIQLAEPSTYQENYKIIFKDFDLFGSSDNNINNNVFTVRGRNDLSDVLMIDNTNTTMICVNDISHYIINDDIYYLVDKTYNRVFRYDTLNKIVDSYNINSNIVDISLDIKNDVLYIATSTIIYVLGNNSIVVYSEEYSNINTVYYVETADKIVVVTKNTIHYNNNNIVFRTGNEYDKSCFVNNIENSNFYFYYTIESKIYRVLFNLTTNISFQNESFVYDLGIGNFINDISAVITQTGIDLFVVDSANDCYRIGDEFIIGIGVVNKNILTFTNNVFKAKPYNNKLYSVVDFDNNKINSIIVETEFNVKETGFGNLYSTIKAEDVNNPTFFYYYDDKTNRIVYTDLEGNYTNDMIVDVTGYEVKQIIWGGNNTAYSLIKKGSDYYIGRLFINTNVLSLDLGKVQINNSSISKLFYDGSNLYFLYSDNIICRYAFSVNTTDISNTTRYTFDSLYSIVDYYIHGDKMYVISNEKTVAAHYKLDKTTFTNFGVKTNIVDNSSTVLKSVFVKNEIIYLLNENGIVILDDNFSCIYDENLLYLPGTFDNIRFYNNEYFTTNYSYITKRYKFEELSLSNKIKSFCVTEHDTELNVNNAKNLYVLSENVIRYNDIIIAGKYKIIRETPSNSLYDPYVNPSDILNSSMNPMNPMCNVEKIIYARQNNKGYIYFAEQTILYRISVIPVTDAGYISAININNNIDKYTEATLTNYKTFYHHNIDNNFVVKKELVYDFSSTTEIIIDMALGGTTDYSDTLMFIVNTGDVYIHLLDNTLSTLFKSSTSIASGYDIIVPEPTMNNRFYLVSSSSNIMNYVGLSGFNMGLYTFDAVMNNTFNKTVVLDISETIDDIFVTYTTQNGTSYNLCVRTNTRTFYVGWSGTPVSVTYDVEMPFIIDDVLLDRPILSKTLNSNFVYLYEDSRIYRLDVSTSSTQAYVVTYLAKSPSNNYAFISIDDTTGKYVTRQKLLNNSSRVIDTKIKVMFDDISTSTVSKIVSVSDNIAYVLMSDGILYKNDYSVLSREQVNVGYGNIVYRGTNNTVINGLTFKITDICNYKTKLLINLEILDGTKYYNDVFVLELNNTTNKNDIKFLYNYKPLSGSSVDTNTLYPMDINGDDILTTPTTNMVYLYESSVPYSTKISTNNFIDTDMITLSFYVDNTTANYVNRINKFKTEYVFSDGVSDYYVVTIPTYNNILPATGKIYPVDNSGNAIPFDVTFTNTVSFAQTTLLYNQTYMVVDITGVPSMINNDCNIILNYVVDMMGNENILNDYFVTNNSGVPYNNMTSPNVNLLYSSNTALYSNGVAIVKTYNDSVKITNTANNTKETFIYPKTFNIDNIINTKTTRIDTVDVFNIINLITNFSKYSNIYIETEVLKLYKTIYNIATPFVSARIINDSIINNGSDMNMGGTSKTLYFMNSIWNNGAFTGSWNEPNRIDNNPVSKTSFFVNGSFKGDFHKGFFLGGDISTSTIYNGHMIANTNNINIDSNTIVSTNRYDITNMIVDNNIMRLDIDTIINNQKIETNILPGAIVTIPNVFISDKLFISDVTDLPLNVDGKKCVMVSIPTIDDTLVNRIELESNVLIFSKNNVGLNNYFRVVEKNHNVDINTLELVIETNVDVTKLVLTGNNDIYLSLNEYFILHQDNDGYYIKIDKEHLLPYIDVKDNKVMLHTNNYKQLFTSSFTSGFYDLTIESNIIENSYLNNISYIGKTIKNCVVSKSNIDAELIYQSFIYSGNVKSKEMVLSHIMCVDKNGYVVDNQEYTSNIESDILGENIEILSYGYDTLNDRISITTNGVLNDISRYSFIGIRGFSGNNSARLGANYSVIHRIEDISNDGNTIYIKNNVFGDTDVPNLSIVNQTIKLRDTSGQNLRTKSADILQLTDYTFKTGVSLNELPDSKTWIVLGNSIPDILLVEDGYEIIPDAINDTITIYQKLNVDYTIEEWGTIFISNIKSDNLDITYDILDVNKNTLLNVVWTGEATNPIQFNANNSSGADISNSDLYYFAINIKCTDINKGYLNKVFLDSVVNKINFTNNVDFNYAYVSNSSISLVSNNFNNGNITSVWNSGVFNNGVFNGKWFGSNPYTSYAGTYIVDNKKIIGLPSILENKSVYVKFNENNIDGVLTQIYVPVYAKVLNNSIDLATSEIINIVDGTYDISILDINDRNIIFGDGNNNIIGNNNTNIKFNVPSSKNGMLISNYLKSDIYNSFTIKLDYDKTIQSDISPLISFINNETMIGVRIFYSKVHGGLVFVDEYKNVLVSNTIDLINNSGSIMLGIDQITYTYGTNIIDFDLNYIGRTAFRINNKYEYVNYESNINSVEILGDNTKTITNFDFLYQDRFISSDYVLNNDDKTYVFNGTNKFKIGGIQHINPLIDFTLVNEKSGSIIYLTSTIKLDGVTNKYSLSLESSDIDGIYYKINVVERFRSGVDSNETVVKVLFTTDVIKYCDKTHIVLSKDTIYINGTRSGNFISLNRNIIQYTDNTVITLGLLDYYENYVDVNSITGYITDINIWNNESNIDVYDVYLTDVLPKTNLSINRNTPYYSHTSGYTMLETIDKNIDDKYYTSLNGIANIDWLKAVPSTRIDFATPQSINQITLTNMSNFQFFGKKYNTGNDGELQINTTRNGYIFFDVYLVDGKNYISEASLPYADFGVDSSFDNINKSFNNMDAIVVNTNLNSINNTYEYYVGYIDKPTYAVIVYYYGVRGNATTINTDDEIYRVYLDKVTSTISTYITNVPSDDAQKLFGLMRKDGVKVFIQDPKYKFEKYAGVNDVVYNNDGENISDILINNSVIISYQPQILKTVLDESLVAEKLYTHDYTDLIKTNKISFLGDSYDYDVKKYDISEYSYMTTTPNILYPNKSFIGEMYDYSKSSASVARMSYFNGGQYNSDIWYNGIFTKGEITKNGFIWKFGVKLNGVIRTADSSLKNYAHWLGGYCEGSNDIGLLENVVWYRGKHSGGMFRKGYIFAYDYNMDDFTGYTIFDKMVIYSDISKKQTVVYDNIFVADKKIQLVPNTEYELSVPIDGINIPTSDGINIPTSDVDISWLIGDDFNKIKIVEYKYVSGTGKYITTTSNEIAVQESPVTNKMIISVRFNSGNMNNIQFLSGDIASITNTTITNYKLMGYKVVTPNIDITLLEDFNTVWNSGKVINKTEELNYLSPYTKTYKVSDTTITLPLVDTTILGCLWLSGAFDGGIIANTFWYSVDVSSDISSTTNLSEIKLRHLYDGEASKFLSGKMINSVWFGGYVNNTSSKQNVVFGDILSNYQNYKINDDYKTPSDFIGYVKSTLPSAYKTVLGKKIFTGYYLTNDSTISNSQIEYNRVTSQNNIDGIMSVYIHRGDVSNSIIQHSVIQSYDMDNMNSYDMTVPVKYVTTTDSHIFMSQINGLMFRTNATSTDVRTLHLTTPNSIVYQSEWNYGIWDIFNNGGIDSGVTTDKYITDALISRSIWNTGEFHGGTMNNSIWRSGYHMSVKYNTVETDISTDNISLVVANNVTTHKTYDYNYNINNFDITDNEVRYVGHVDNCASIFFNGRMNGCIWHGGVFMRGMFTDKTYINATKTFDTVDEPINSYNFVQKAVFTRGVIRGGYFGKYINNSADISTYILSYSAIKMTNNNTMLGTNDITPDTYSVFLTRNNIRVNTNEYIPTLPKVDYPYFCVINCLVSGGYLYNDTLLPNNDSVLFNSHARVGDTFISVPQPNEYVFENGLGNNITIYPGNPYVYDDGNINIKQRAISNNVDISWRHNMYDLNHTSDIYNNYYYYSDNTKIDAPLYSIAQGDGSILVGSMYYGEPIYRNEVITLPNNQFMVGDFINTDFKI